MLKGKDLRNARKPQPGDLAVHISGSYDAREVLKVSEDGTKVKVRLMGIESAWLPAGLYVYKEKPTHE